LSRSGRHTVILVIVTLSACLAAFGGWRFAKASAPVNGPIILVSIDALRADHLPAYGYRSGRTPAIDALAADGIVFERAYSHVPETLPAHVAMLTGRLPFESGVRDAAGPALPDSVRTVADILRDRGYATGGIVSSFLLRRETGIARGFSFYDAELPAGDDLAPAARLMRDGADSEQVAEHWLDSIGTSRAFLFLHLADPHAPHAAPERFAPLPPYDAEVAYADEVVGRLVRYLKSHQLYDRATVILVSDHGEGLGDHGEQTHGVLLYDEALHVPLIIKQPGGEGGKRRVQAPVQHIDLVPTILDLAKAPGASGLRGRSLTPLFTGGSIAPAPIYSESLFAQSRFGWWAATSVIDGQYQLVSHGKDVELFDLAAAAADRHDIAGEHADVAAAARKGLAEFTSVRGPQANVTVTPADRERFDLLGYVGRPGTPASADDAATPSRGEVVQFIEGYRNAVQLAAANDVAGAIDAYRALTERQPANADLWLHLARVAARAERHDVALDALKQVLAIDPGSVPAQLAAATSYLRTRRLDDAAALAQAAIDGGTAEKIQLAEAHELLARVAVNRRDLDTARAEAASAQEADPLRPVAALIEGRIALDQARYAEAADSFDQALAAAAKAGRAPLADLRVFAADALTHVSRADEAEKLLADELRAYPANSRARTALQALYRSMGRAADAAALAQH
jgi:arylsulfatase A-like enzyme